MARLVRYEQQVSRRRQGLQRTADDCSAEIARRYREGEAQVDDLLCVASRRGGAEPVHRAGGKIRVRPARAAA